MTATSFDSLRGKTVVVTGATGFIGSHLVAALVDVGANVFAVADSLGWRPTVAKLVEARRVRFIQLKAFWDQAALDEVAANFSGAELLVHLAYAPPPPGRLVDRAAVEVERNLLGTIRLVRALPPSVRHVCFASSVMVYGPSPPLPVSEDQCPSPASEYAIAKLATEEFLRAYADQSDLAVSVLRYATVYGQMETVPRAIPNFIRQILAGAGPVIDGDGDEVRDYVHVSDATQATLLTLARATPGHVTYNVGSGEGHGTVEIAERVKRLMASDARVTHVPTRSSRVRIVCDISRARNQLGYEPVVGLDDGLAEEIRWFESHPRLWARSN